MSCEDYFSIKRFYIDIYGVLYLYLSFIVGF